MCCCSGCCCCCCCISALLGCCALAGVLAVLAFLVDAFGLPTSLAGVLLGVLLGVGAAPAVPKEGWRLVLTMAA
jgi:phosphate/sulfate permease